MSASEAQDHTEFMDPDEQIEYLHAQLADVRRQAEAQVRAAHTDCAQVLALMAAIWPAVISRNDPTRLACPVLYVQTVVGRLPWRIAPEDMPLFVRVPVVPPFDERARWDGHTTEQKNARMAQLRGLLADREDT